MQRRLAAAPRFHDDKPLPVVMGGGLDPIERKAPHESLSTWLDLPDGVTLSPVPGGQSTIAHVLGSG